MLPPRRLLWIPAPPVWIIPVLLAVLFVALAVRSLP
jgi:hypothetical protein